MFEGFEVSSSWLNITSAKGLKVLIKKTYLYSPSEGFEISSSVIQHISLAKEARLKSNPRDLKPCLRA